MKREISFIVSENENNFSTGELLRIRGVSRRLVNKLKRTEDGITCNGVHIRTVDSVKTGDVISIAMEDSKVLEANSALNVPIVYDDDDVVVFNKPIGMPVHPSIKHQGDTLGNYFSYLYPEYTFRPINRLDRDTSGLCAVAKNAHSANVLQHNIDKIYFAVVCGVINESGRINAPIGREDESIIKRVVRDDGQDAVTDYTIIQGNDEYTLVRVKLQTGRTHQIRVHFSHIGYPLAGDNMYGGITKDISAQALHCGELSFVHPVTKEKIGLVSEIRDDMARLVENIS